MRPPWLAFVAGAVVGVRASPVDGQLIPRIPGPTFPLNGSAIVATPIAISTTTSPTTDAPSAPTVTLITSSTTSAHRSACGGRVVNAPSVQLFYCAPIHQITASTALNGAVCTANTYTPYSATPTQGPTAAETVTVRVQNAPTPVATVTRSTTYPLESTKAVYEKTLYSDFASPTKKGIAAPIPGLDIVVTYPTPYIYLTELEIEDTEHDAAAGSCITSKTTTTLPTPIPVVYKGTVPKVWKRYNGTDVTGRIPAAAVAAISSAVHIGAFQPGTYAGRPTIVEVFYTTTLISCPTAVPALSTPARTSTARPLGTSSPSSIPVAPTAIATTAPAPSPLPPAWGSVIASIFGITVPVPVPGTPGTTLSFEVTEPLATRSALNTFTSALSSVPTIASAPPTPSAGPLTLRSTTMTPAATPDGTMATGGMPAVATLPGGSTIAPFPPGMMSSMTASSPSVGTSAATSASIAGTSASSAAASTTVATAGSGRLRVAWEAYCLLAVGIVVGLMR